MTIPSLSRSWTFSVNNAFIATGTVQGSFRNFWFQIKNSLKTIGGWTVIASSNSTLVGTTVGDNWLSTASLVWGASARSWIILQNPANGSQILIDLSNATTSSATLLFSTQGWNVSGVLSNTALPPTNIVGDSITLINNTTVAWGNTDQNFVHHYMYSNDGYCHRHFVYVNDYCVFGLFLETPENPATGWVMSGLPSFAMIFNAASIANAITTAAYTSARVNTRIQNTTSISAFLSGESFGGGSVIPYQITNPSVFDNSYSIVTPGIISTTAPYRGKLGKPIDLWFGMPNFLGSITYPDDNTRQLAGHGGLITPWNGSVMKTR